MGETPTTEDGLQISLLDEEQGFRSGDSVTLRILVTRQSKKGEKPVGGAAVSVKVLGTSFRPVIHSVKTERDGIATISAQIPQFTSGRAAILVRATAGGLSTEVRRVVHPA